MITIIHGDDISSSRNYFLELKTKHKDLIVFDSKNLTITNLVQNIKGSGLFSETNTIFIEDFLTKVKKAIPEAKEILTFITKNSKESNFIMWESKEISKRDLFSFKDAVVKSFKLPQNIFLFLDSLKPNNTNKSLNLFHQAINSGIKEELILFMLQRQIRLLLALLGRNPERSEGSIDEITRLAPWQMGKLEKQANFFEASKLKYIYKKLYEIELAQKTGGLSLSLSQTIDFLLMEM